MTVEQEIQNAGNVILSNAIQTVNDCSVLKKTTCLCDMLTITAEGILALRCYVNDYIDCLQGLW